MKKPMLSIIVPAYNEARTLKKNMLKLHNYCTKLKLNYELIIIDDGSTDETYTIAQKIQNATVLQNTPNKGKGYSVQKGVNHARSTYTLICDCDLSTDLSEIPVFLNSIKHADIVIGSRATKNSHVQTRFHKHLAGRFSSLFIRSILWLPFKDTQCGFKLFQTSVAKKLFSKLTIHRWGFDFEILYLAKKYKYTIIEKGVKWVENTDSKVTLKDYPKTLIELLKIRYEDVKGTYSQQKNIFQKTTYFLDDKRITQFVFVGGSGVVLNLAIVFLLTEFYFGQDNYFYAYLIGLGTNIIYNFTLHTIVTFQTQTHHSLRFIGFGIYTIAMSFLQAIVVKNLVNLIGTQYYLLIIASIISIFSLVTFVLFKFVLFKKKSQK